MTELVRLMKKIIFSGILFPLRIVPVKRNRVLLLNELALKYSGNPKYVAEYLLTEYPNKFQLVIPVKKPKQYEKINSKEIRFIKFNSPQYFFYGMTSKVFLTNSGGFSYIPLRKKQYVINTWHGGGAYKTAGTDMYEDTPLFRFDLFLSSSKTNAFLSTNRRFSDELSRAMLVPRKRFWEIGMPRNDMLIHPDDSVRARIRNQIGIKKDEKLVLFAPTYRKTEDNYYKDSISIAYGLDGKKVREAFEKRFGGTWVLGYRLHPCIVNRDEYRIEDAIDLTDYEEMQELLLASDAMINDFSSTLWDYLHTGKPCFMYAADMEQYIKTTEVYTPVDRWPFPKAVSNDELIDNILTFDEKKYEDDCNEHYRELGGCETGKATELVCRRIYKVCFERS